MLYNEKKNIKQKKTFTSLASPIWPCISVASSVEEATRPGTTGQSKYGPKY